MDYFSEIEQRVDKKRKEIQKQIESIFNRIHQAKALGLDPAAEKHLMEALDWIIVYIRDQAIEIEKLKDQIKQLHDRIIEDAGSKRSSIW